MAHMSQENKRSKAPVINKILRKYGISGSLSVRNHSALVLTIRTGSIDFMGNYNNGRNVDMPSYIDVNTYYIKDHFSGAAMNCLTELLKVMGEGNWDHSDAMSDYFDVGWYVDINIGEWDRPYILKRP